MREHFGYAVKSVSDHLHKELMPEEILDIFKREYVNVETPLRFKEVHYVQENGITATITVENSGAIEVYTASGNGRLDSVANALRDQYVGNKHVTTYEEHSLELGSTSRLRPDRPDGRYNRRDLLGRRH